MPFYENFFDETCKNIIKDCNDGVYNIPLFLMALVPEGTPVWDKLTPLLDLYVKYKNELDKHGIKNGILLQSTLGHGGYIVPALFKMQKAMKNVFHRYFNLKTRLNGKSSNEYLVRKSSKKVCKCR